MVQQTTRGCDQNIDALVDQLVLLLEADAANQQRFRQFQVLGVGVGVFRHLGRQFARRAQDQTAWHAGAGAAPGQSGDHRQSKGSGLPGAGLRDAQNIASLQSGRNGTGLDWGGGFIPGFLNCLEDLGVQVQIGEFCHLRPLLRTLTRPARVCIGQASQGHAVWQLPACGAVYQNKGRSSIEAFFDDHPSSLCDEREGVFVQNWRFR